MSAALRDLRSFQRRFDKGAAFKRFQKCRLTFLEDLSTTLKAGAQLGAAIIESARRCEDTLLGQVYQDIRERLSGGERLSTAMGAWFTPDERMLLEAFLEGARTNEGIGDALGSMAKVIGPHEEVAAARRWLGRSAAVRALLAMTAVAVMSVSLLELKAGIPTSRWPGWILTLTQGIEAVGQWWVPIVAAAILLPFFAFYGLRTWTGLARRGWDRKVPGFRTYREVHGSMLMIALGAYTAAGRGVGESCRLLATSASPWLRSYLGLIQHRAHKEKGADIVDVGLFEWRQMVRVVCLASGVGLPTALRTVGLDASDLVAKQMLARLKQVDVALAVTQKTITFTCVFVILSMYFAMIGMAVTVSR